MKKSLAILAIFTAIFSVNAQEQEADTLNGWKKFGTITLLFNQAAYNAEWQGGEVSNYAGSGLVDLNFNYKQDDFTWDNKFIGEYGVSMTDDQEFMRKTSDRLEFLSIAGKQIKESNWYYSFFLNFKTQFTSGYEYEDEDVIDPVTGDITGTETTRTETTQFLSPGYLQFGPGLLWKKSDNLKVNIAPATARFIFVDDKFTSIPGYVDGDYYGVDQGETTRFEFGASVNAYAKFQIMENVSMENILGLYSNYLEDPQNLDLDYTMNLAMKINSFLSANVIFQAIYDDNAVKAFQIREVLGIGLTYGFGDSGE